MSAALLLALSVAIPLPQAGGVRGGLAREPASLRPVLAVAREVFPAKNGATLPRAGDLFGPDSLLETTKSGWAEIDLVGIGRARLSADTRVGLDGDRQLVRLSVQRGRAWIERQAKRGARASLEIVLGAHTIRAVGGGSLVVERTHLGGALTVLSGTATVRHASGSELKVGVSHTVRLDEDRPAREPEVAAGGTMTLMRMEARERLGDRAGLGSFVLARARTTPIGARPARELREPHRGSASVMGGDSGPAGRLLEEALRAPPFFESEVPPKGPNVSVEVVFDE